MDSETKIFEINPLAAKELKDNVRILTAIAASEPDLETARAQLGQIYTDLEKSEKACEELLEAIRDSKKFTVKQLNNKIIDSQELKVGHDE